jgi:hypothetical protein
MFVYLSCLDASLRFAYAEGAKVHFKSPTVLGDYISQSLRFRASLRENRRLFGDLAPRIGLSTSALIGLLVRHLADGFLWLAVNGYVYAAYWQSMLARAEADSSWQPAESTK